VKNIDQRYETLKVDTEVGFYSSMNSYLHGVELHGIIMMKLVASFSVVLILFMGTILNGQKDEIKCFEFIIMVFLLLFIGFSLCSSFYRFIVA
jgi:hypothetical protein